MAARRRMIVVAGPPGSGKSRYFPLTAFGVDAFNIDDRCAQILGSYRAIPRDVRRAVAKECERFVLDHIARRESFAVETTLRTTAAIEQAELAREGGFATQMRFVATDSIAENVTRVLQRAQAGGHGASEREIRAIHAASVSNLRRAIATFERVRVYDSTARWTPPRLVAVARGGRVARQGATPSWLEAALADRDA
ncbi:MAG: zeta toxin family protein [Myxococcales bacterium]|nr:zeta toxin family protein [Myxococcales bacterium]